MKLSDMKKAFYKYKTEKSAVDRLFFKEDMPIAYLRKHYTLRSEYHTQNEVLGWDALSSIFKIICTTTVRAEYVPVYNLLGQFQKLFGLCTDGRPYNYELDVIFNTPINTLDNWKMLYDHRRYLKEIAAGIHAFVEFYEAYHTDNFLNDLHFKMICDSNQHAEAVGKGIAALASGRCLIATYRNFILQHQPYADAIGSIIATLHLKQVAIRDLLPLIARHESHAPNILFFVEKLSDEACHLENIRFIYEYPQIFGDGQVYELSANLRHSITAHQFQEMRTAILHAAGDTVVMLGHMEHLVNQWLRPARRAGVTASRPSQPQINYAESVHNIETERSAAESVKRLKEAYPRALCEHLRSNLAGISHFIGSLDRRNPKHIIAKKAFDRFKTEEPTDSYAREGVRFPQALSLIWEAMHDIPKLIKPCTLDVAKERLITALCETQQESINDDAQDQSPGDLESCVGGSFTKIIDTLHAVHSAIEINHISMESAGYKVQALTREAVQTYLKRSQREKPDTFSSLLDSLKSEGVYPIFKDIRTQIADALFAEFQSLFESKEDSAFMQLVNTAMDVEIGEVLKAFENPTSENQADSRLSLKA